MKLDTCRGCVFRTNSAQLHNDAFTSSPARLVWYCEYGVELEVITDDLECPRLNQLEAANPT